MCPWAHRYLHYIHPWSHGPRDHFGIHGPIWAPLINYLINLANKLLAAAISQNKHQLCFTLLYNYVPMNHLLIYPWAHGPIYVLFASGAL